MLRKSWGSLAQAGQCLALAYVLAVHPGIAGAQLPDPLADQNVETETQDDANDLGDLLGATAPAIYSIQNNPAEDQDAVQRGEVREQADLLAQERMAKAAEELTTLTRIQNRRWWYEAIVIGVGVLSAIAAAVFGFIQASAARKTLEGLERPSLFTSERSVVFRVVESQLADGTPLTTILDYYASCQLMNYGRAPAFLRYVLLEIGQGLTDDIDRAWERLIVQSGTRPEVGILPGKESKNFFLNHTEPFDEGKVAAIEERRESVWLRGHIFYEDFTGRTYERAFCIGRNGLPAGGKKYNYERRIKRIP